MAHLRGICVSSMGCHVKLAGAVTGTDIISHWSPPPHPPQDTTAV